MKAVTSPMTPTAARVTIAKAYARPGVDVMPATRMVPAIAAPREEPRFDTLRESPEISPCLSSPKLDWTTFTEGVSIPPSPKPISSSPGTKANLLWVPVTRKSRTPTPAMVTRKPTRMRVRWGNFLASLSAASDETRIPTVAAVKMTPVSMAL